MAPTAELELPSVFGRYLLLRRLSRGGMGEIFVAKSGQLSGFEKLCVIKKVLPNLAEDREFIHRFIDEASVAIKLSHASIAQVFEVGMAEGEYFLAMEWVDGRDVRRILSRLLELKRRLPVEHALLVMRDVASALAYAHRRTDDGGQSLNLVHCDISPPNVIVAFEGEVKVIDFGIAKSALRATQTNPKIGFGKYGYMAPEQLVQGGVVDRRTDVYACGVLLYELLTGRRMFMFPEGADYRAMARIVAQGQHPRPSHIDPQLAPLDDLVLTAVAPDPSRRFSSAEELRDALQMALAARSPTLTGDRLGSFVRELFAEEMNEEREALKQARAVDLTPYVDELADGTTDTVTFAAAEEGISGIRTGERRMPPLPAPPEDGSSPGYAFDDDEEPTVVDGAPRFRAREPTVGPMLVDPEPEPVPAGRRRTPLLLAGLAGVALAAVIVLARGGGGPGATKPSTPSSEAPRRPLQPFVVQPMPPAAARPAASTPPPVVPVASDERPAAETPPRVEARPPRPTPPVIRPSASRPTAVEPAEAPSPTSVQAKYQAVARDYAEFKRRYGARLETDWNDILDFATYGVGDDKHAKLDAKLSTFRKRMSQVRAGAE